VVSRSKSSQNVRVAARSRISSARAAKQKLSSAAEDWVPSGLHVSSPGAAPAVTVVEEADAVPTDPPAAAELGAEVKRLRQELGRAKEEGERERERAERAEGEAAQLRERAEAMKRAAARAAAAAHPGDGSEDPDGRVKQPLKDQGTV
jgi:type IV secretory pathway VirB10-like protein